MRIIICEDKNDLGKQAAKTGAEKINNTIAKKGFANVAFVTGNSQIQTLKNLRDADIEWDKVNVFLLDEFIGITKSDKASSLVFLTDNLLKYLPSIGSIHPIDSDSKKTEETLKKLNEEMKNYPLDVVFICIGENGHLAFNDPPADLYNTDSYIKVELEKRNKRQLMHEGWFKSVDDVPDQAITMSVSEILSSASIVISCPDQRKAKAVAMTLYDDFSPMSPCAMVRRAEDVSLFLDRQSSCLILKDNRQLSLK